MADVRTSCTDWPPALAPTNQWKLQPWRDTPRKLILSWDPPRDLQIKALKTETLHTISFSQACPHLSSLLSPKVCIYVSPLSSKGHCFASVTRFLSPFLLWPTSTCDFLNKLSLLVWVLALNSFLARTQVLRLLNRGLTPGAVLLPTLSFPS